MPVIYDGNSIRPAPPVSLTKTYQTLGDGRNVGVTTTATLHGTIVATKTGDVETPLNIEYRLAAILKKQQELRDIFAHDGRWLEIQGLDGSAPVKFQAVVQSIEFQEGPWVDRCDYTVTLQGEHFADENPPEDNHVESATESWQFEEGEGPHTYHANHQLQAKGKAVYDPGGAILKAAWENARDFVRNKLRLDWTTSNPAWSAQSGSQIFTSGQIDPEPGMAPFNRVIQENVDELDGTYQVTETFFLSADPFWEEYTASVRREHNDPLMTTTVSISGTIHGLYTGLHNPEGRLANALSRWNTVKTLVLTRAQAYASGASLSPQAVSATVDTNINEGTVNYQYEFNDRKLVNDTYEFWSVSPSASLEDVITTVAVEGTVTGVLYPGEYDPTLRYERALNRWNTVKLLVFGRAVSESGVPDLQPFPVSASVTPNKQDGSVSYSFTFNNRNPVNVRHECTVSTHFSREDGRTVVTVDGTVTGYRSANASWPFTTNSPQERYQNALNYFNSISGNIVGLAANYVDVSTVNPLPFSKAVSHLETAGQVTYQFEFNSLPRPCVVGALSENITISDDAATAVIAIIPVLGRAKGPVIQNIGTVKEKRRTVTIELVMPTDLNTNMCAVSGGPSVNISAYAPLGNPVYLEQDQTQWSPSSGHYSRTVSWVYE